MRARNHIFIVGFLVVLSTGCAVGPNYKKPAVPIPPEFRGLPPDQTGKTDAASFGDQKWWDAFPERAQLGITRADQLPTVTAGAAAVNEKLAQTIGIPSVDTSANQVSASLAWELDFWGKFRRATESARAVLLAQEWVRKQVISSLVSDVASAYFQLRELDLELEISQHTLAARKDSLRLTQTLADGGATSMLDVRQAEQLVYAAAAAIPDTERQIEQQENFISILLGKNPQAIVRGKQLVEEPHALEVPAGLPSSLLERRPDIRQAEQQLVATNAQIGVAKADFFPQISLTATGGYQSSALTSLFTGPAGLWSFGGNAVQPVFEGGRIRNQVRLAQARTQEATLFYQQTVQQAFRDVSDALVGYRKNQEFRIQQEQLTHSAEEATKLSNMRYKGGATSYLEVLDSDTRYFTAQLGLAKSDLNELLSFVDLYRALGGGWD